MATYGAKMLQWAPFATTDPDTSTSALPKYGQPINIGALQKVSDSPTFAEAKIYGDNALKGFVKEFKEATVNVEITDLLNSVASAILGAKLDTGDAAELHFNVEDNAPYGGLAFYINKMDSNNKKKWQGIFYPKLKASMEGEEYATKGESITLVGGKIAFLASAPANGDWKIKSMEFETEAEAVAWVNGKIKAATA